MRNLLLLFILLFSLSVSYAQDTREIEKKLKTAKAGERVVLLTELAENYLASSQKRRALEPAKEASKLLRLHNVDEQSKARLYNVLATAYFYNKDYSRAITYYEKELEIIRFNNTNRSEAMNSLYNIATLYEKMENYGMAAETYRKSLKMAELHKSWEVAVQNCLALTEVYSHMQKYKDALQYYQTMIKYQNRIEQKEDVKKINILQNEYDNIKKTREEQEAELERQKKRLQNAQKRADKLRQESSKKEKEIKNLSNITKQTEEELREKENEVEQRDDLIQEGKTQLAEREKIIGLFVLALLLTVAILVLIFRMFKAKGRAVKQLEKQKNALEKQKIEIEEKRKEIEIKKDEIEKQNTDILEITDRLIDQTTSMEDSILYAQQIQNSLLPPLSMAKEIIGDNFIFFQPRDAVSGDFYWYAKIRDRSIVVAADCTGHGIPGAFMSMLGISLLNEIVISKRIVEPDRILNLLRKGVIKALKQEDKNSISKDGMDMAILSIDRTKNILHFAGANNPTYFVRGRELTVYKGDKMPVAIYPRKGLFKRHVIKIKRGDMFYIFSDGYSDQFGGEKRKKFMYKRLKQLILDNRYRIMSVQRDIFEKTFLDWKGKRSQIDDVLVMGIKI